MRSPCQSSIARRHALDLWLLQMHLRVCCPRAYLTRDDDAGGSPLSAAYVRCPGVNCGGITMPNPHQLLAITAAYCPLSKASPCTAYQPRGLTYLELRRRIKTTVRLSDLATAEGRSAKAPGKQQIPRRGDGFNRRVTFAEVPQVHG